jgi:hypothetical protein
MGKGPLEAVAERFGMLIPFLSEPFKDAALDDLPTPFDRVGLRDGTAGGVVGVGSPFTIVVLMEPLALALAAANAASKLVIIISI